MAGMLTILCSRWPARQQPCFAALASFRDLLTANADDRLPIEVAPIM
jgi:hypothetical protein